MNFMNFMSDCYPLQLTEVHKFGVEKCEIHALNPILCTWAHVGYWSDGNRSPFSTVWCLWNVCVIFLPWNDWVTDWPNDWLTHSPHFSACSSPGLSLLRAKCLSLGLRLTGTGHNHWLERRKNAQNFFNLLWNLRFISLTEWLCNLCTERRALWVMRTMC